MHGNMLSPPLGIITSAYFFDGRTKSSKAGLTRTKSSKAGLTNFAYCPRTDFILLSPPLYHA